MRVSCTGSAGNYHLPLVLEAAEQTEHQQAKAMGRISISACSSNGCGGSDGDDSAQKIKRAVQPLQHEWRLPNVKELLSVVEEACSEPSINEKFFPGTPGGEFMTSTMVAATGNSFEYVWAVNFNNGRSLSHGSIYNQVRLVRIRGK